jgi:histone H4
MAKRFKKEDKHGGNLITKGDIRRMARRGGVKRISAEIYPTTR